jgi:8-oxo-dGTP diphosphatase
MKKETNKKDHTSDLMFAIIATDVVVFKIENNTLKTLLVHVVGNPFFPDSQAVVGGLIGPAERAIESVERLLLQKAGISGVYAEQLYTFDAIDRDPRGRVIAVAYIAIAQDVSVSHTMFEIEWRDIKKLPKLAYDHNEIIKTACERLRSRITYTNIVQYFLPKEFTLSDLQHVYEIILDKPIDRRNFRKKIMAGDFLKDTGKTKKVGVMRPATLYSFRSKQIEMIDIL